MRKREGLRPIWERELWFALLAVFLCWLGFCSMLKIDPLGHSPSDSFTLIARAWREGRFTLKGEYPHLELAMYNGQQYVSFPSVPALAMLPLTYLFGENTPNVLMDGLYLMGACAAAYFTARRWREPWEAALFGVFITLGSSAFNLALSGDVWYQAQLLSLLLMCCFGLGITGDGPPGWGLGLVCLALAVGCRPFQACFVPFGLYMLYRRLREKHGLPLPQTLLRMAPYLVAPALVALLLGWYNWVRFSNPFEFGHNYLPEFTEDPEQVQLGLKYIPNNLANIFRLPEYRDGRLEFSMFDGFAFYLTNPMLVTAGLSALQKRFRRRWDGADTLLLTGLAAELFLLLCHRTLGGWQYGTRYLCDLLPMLLLMELRGRDRMEWWEIAICAAAVGFNMYGTIVFHLMDMGV